ncbi:MAG TPA: acyl carrier protein [Mycobacteriales bacterium]|nr:acyl carrier protein [Mycobacteriales bacterium]
MTSADVRDFTIRSLKEMNYDVSEVTDDSVLGPAGLDLESLAIAELAVRIEDEYKVTFSDEEQESVGTWTLGEFVTAVSARLQERAGAGDSAV